MNSLIYQYIIQSANEIFEKYKQRKGKLTIPMDLGLLAKLRKAYIEEVESDDPSFEGQLLPVKRGFIIQCNKKLPQARKNMAICHEIAHTFSFDLSYLVPRRLSQKFPYGEGTCYLLARELLVPRELLEDIIFERKEYDIKWKEYDIIQSLEFFSGRFQTSKEVMAERLTSDISLIKDIMFIFWRLRKGQKNSFLSEELAKNFTRYWRTKYIYPMILSRYVLDVTKSKQKKKGYELIRGEKKIKGKVKENRLYVECELQRNIISAVKVENSI